MPEVQRVSFTEDETKEVKVYSFSADETQEKSKGELSLWRQDLKRPLQLAQCAAAEVLGTAILVWITSTSCATFPGNGGTLQSALTVACILATLIQSLSHAGGCHINPAVTLGFLMLKKISWLRVLVYQISQNIGAIAGSAFYMYTTPEAQRGVGLCATTLNEAAGVTVWQGLAVELVLTMVLVLTVILSYDDYCSPKQWGPFFIGLAAGACVFVGIPYTGASLNPARTFGPALLENNWEHNWIYNVGPNFGANLAVLFYSMVIRKPQPAVQENQNLLEEVK